MNISPQTHTSNWNSDLSVWLSVDPLSDKYPSMNAFMYCAGNPLILVDPDGRRIWIFGEDGQKTLYKQGMEYNGKDLFTKNTILALNKISEHKESSEKIQHLIEDKNTNFNIVETDRITTFEVEIAGGQISNGDLVLLLSSNQTIKFNPLMGLEDKNTGKSLAPFIALFHELGHSYNAQQNSKAFINRLNDKTESEIWIDAEEKYNIKNNEVPLSRFFKMLERQNYSNDYNTIITKGVLTNEKK